MGKRSPGALAVQGVFCALVIATLAAFFVTTRLKRSPPLVEQLTFARHFSPNDDGRRDDNKISFRLRREDDTTVSIVDEGGEHVATLVDDRRLMTGRHSVIWNGKSDDGKTVSDGEYFIRIALRHQGRTITSPHRMFLDTTPPQPVVRYVSPDTISPDGAGRGNRATVRFIGPTRKPPTLLVYRTDRRRPRLVARRTGRRGSGLLSWDGRVGLGRVTRPAPAGNYLMAVRARDVAGNDGPASLPPKRQEVRGHPGLVVRYLAAIPPQEPVGSGRVARIQVLADGRAYRWSLRRAGMSRALTRGRSSRRILAVRMPRTSRSGVYLVDLRLGRHRYQTPVSVRATRPARVLVLLPWTSWIARDPIDSNGDGYADLLPLDKAVQARRALAGGGLPPGFNSQVVAVLAYLDRHGLRYDVAGDMADQSAATLRPYRGVLYPSSPRFVEAVVLQALRDRTRSGAGIAWFGREGLTATVRGVRDSLVLKHVAPNQNAFGERLRSDPAGGLLSIERSGGLFEGVPSPFGPFGPLELESAAPSSSQLLSNASSEGGQAAIVRFTFGDGFVARFGVDGFGATLAGPQALPSSTRIMQNLWKLLRS